MHSSTIGETPVRILLIEDNPADVYLIREALHENQVHFSLRNIPDGEQAYQFVCNPDAVRQDKPDLIILDLNLPKVEGSEILEAIRSTEFVCDIPVIILTSSDSPQDKKHAAQFGARGYIRKPSTLEAFLQVGAQIKLVYNSLQSTGAVA